MQFPFVCRMICAISFSLPFCSAFAQSPETSEAKGFSKREIEPRIWSCDFYSVSLGKLMRFMVVLPEKIPAGGTRPVIYFLHGRGRHEKSLLESPSAKKRILDSPSVIVLPRGEDGWYIDSPVRSADRYAGYVDEIVALTEASFPASKSPEERGIAGWSMGGYGAIMTAIRRPGDFHAAASIIGLLDFPRQKIAEADQNYSVPEGRFGSDQEVWKKFNPRFHMEELGMTKLFLVIGEQAFDRQMNEVFLQEAKAARLSIESVRLPEKHSFAAVEKGIPQVLEFLERNLGKRQ